MILDSREGQRAEAVSADGVRVRPRLQQNLDCFGLPLHGGAHERGDSVLVRPLRPRPALQEQADEVRLVVENRPFERAPAVRRSRVHIRPRLYEKSGAPLLPAQAGGDHRREALLVDGFQVGVPREQHAEDVLMPSRCCRHQRVDPLRRAGADVGPCFHKNIGDRFPSFPGRQDQRRAPLTIGGV